MGAMRVDDRRWPDGRVLCVWLPWLPLRVEVLRSPAWDGRPLVLGSGSAERKVVQLASPEAAQAGVRPGLPLREVLALCPDAIVVQPDPVRVGVVLEAVLARLRRVSPAVEPAGERMFLDLRGLEAVYRGELTRLERAARAAVPPLLRPRLGVADGKFAAAVAARLAPSGVRVVSAAETAAFLAPLPIAYLPLGSDLLERLDLLGLGTIGDLARLPFGPVQAEFGPDGARAWRLANGRDDEPIAPSHASPSVGASLRFDDPLASVEAILAALERLVARSFASPALAGRTVRQAHLRALLVGGASWERRYTFKEALAGHDAAHRALKSKLELANGLPPAPVEELALRLLGLGGEAARQPGLFSTRPDGPIAETARQLGARYGRVPLYHAVELEPWSRIPERRWALVTVEDGGR